MLRAAVFAVAAVSRYVGVAAQQELGTFDSNAAAQNPLKGMLTSPEWSTPPYLDTLPSSLEFYYVGIADVMESMTSFTGMDTFLEPRLAATASRGKHVVLRLILDYPNRPLPNDVPQFLIDGGLTMNAYTDFGGGLSPDYSSPALLAALDAVIAELGSRFDGDQRLGFLQIGLLGFWGEWHTFGLPDSQGIPAATKDRVIAAFSAAFSQTQVQVRVPWGAALTAGGVLGLHDDSFAYSTLDGADNGGVMVPWFFWPDVVAQGGDTVWQRAAMGGELRPELQETIFNDNYPASTEYHQDYTRCVDLTHATCAPFLIAFELLSHVFHCFWSSFSVNNRLPPGTCSTTKATLRTGATTTATPARRWTPRWPPPTAWDTLSSSPRWPSWTTTTKTRST